jgi:hypothetical protein
VFTRENSEVKNIQHERSFLKPSWSVSHQPSTSCKLFALIEPKLWHCIQLDCKPAGKFCYSTYKTSGLQRFTQRWSVEIGRKRAEKFKGGRKSLKATVARVKYALVVHLKFKANEQLLTTLVCVLPRRSRKLDTNWKLLQVIQLTLTHRCHLHSKVWAVVISLSLAQ